MGCNPVYLAGMDARYKDGISDFYGDNQWHHRTEGDNGTFHQMEVKSGQVEQAGGGVEGESL